MKKSKESRMYSYYLEHKTLRSRRDRGKLIQSIAESEKCHPGTVYRWFDRFDRKEKPSRRRDKGKPRVRIGNRKITEQEKLKYTTMVSGTKIQMLSKDGKTGDTESIVRALSRSGQMPYINRSVMDRWLNDLGLSIRQIKKLRESAGTRLKADYPNQCWVADATTSELYYLRNSDGKRLVKDGSGILTDKNHREEILTRKGYSKLLLFVVVDLYSSAFWYRAYVTPGESSAIWMTFIIDAMSAKEDPRSVLRGIPFKIYADKGSGIGSSTVINEICEILGIELITHLPGNPGAKGKVEARIGKIKSRIEKFMSVENISSLDRYNELAEKFIISENINGGFYQAWSRIHKNPGWLREFDPEIKRRLAFSGQTRVVNAYGCVSLGGIEYYVARRLKDEKVEIYSLPDGTLKAVDRNRRTYELVDPSFQGVSIGKFRSDKKTDQVLLIERAESEGKRLKKILRPEDFIEGAPENVRIFDRTGVTHDVSTPLDSVSFESVDDAWYSICSRTGYGKGDLPREAVEYIEVGLEAVLLENGEIAVELVYKLVDYVSNLMTEVEAL